MMNLKSNSRNESIQTIRAVLESGNAVELTASGYSMFPSLKPGDRVMIKPLPGNDLPSPGSIVVYARDPDNLIVHRLIEIKENMLVTRGDSMTEIDLPVEARRLVGTGISFKRGSSERNLRCYVPSKMKYIMNRFILRLHTLLSPS